MRALKNVHHEIIKGFLVLCTVLLLCLYSSLVRAEFVLTKVDAFAEEGLLQVDADADLNLPSETQEALDSGVDLRIQFLIELVKPRNWVWDEPMNNWEMLFTLHFHHLSGQYVLATPQSDNIQAYNTAQQALQALSSQLSFNLGYVQSLRHNRNMYIRARIKLDTKFLPAPLKLYSLVFSEWKLDSGWREWALEL